MSEVDLTALDRTTSPEGAELRRLQRRLHQAENRTRALEDAIDKAIALNAAAMAVPPVPPPPKDRRRKGEEVAVPWGSDEQTGKKTPTYSTDIMLERTSRYTDKVIELVELHREHAPVKRFRPWWLGDHVEGEDIFPGQPFLIDSSTFEQAFTVAEAKIAQVRRWLTICDRVDVDAVPGNHGRTGRKGQYSKVTNWDRVVFRIIEIALADEPRFTISYPQPTMTDGEGGWYWVSQIGELRTLLIHGDQFRGSLGIPWYGIRKKILGWKAMGANPRMAFPDFDDVAFGHWHQSVSWTVNGIGIRGNGTVESWNDFAAENLAGMGRPSQRLMFVDPAKGRVTAEYPDVWLDDCEPLPDVPWQTLADQAEDEPDE